VLGEELPLPQGHHPPLGERRIGGSLPQMLSEFRRLLSNPDFGPPVLVEQQASGDSPQPPALVQPPPIEP
jgi:hypothetical protein